MNTSPTIDAQMKASYAKRRIPLWVPPSEVSSYLGARNWSEPICIELRDWFARVWSMAFAAGYRNVQRPRIDHANALRMLGKMGYSKERAIELADMLVSGLPSLYNKGRFISGVHAA